jgi:hypothetical protein
VAAGAVLAVLVVSIAAMLRYVRSSHAAAAPFTVPWDSSWPAVPEITAAGALPLELARLVYALVAANEDTLQHVPCYCGCRSQGHQNVHHCHVKRRSGDGQVVEWNEHGRICPIGGDISGDAVYWRQKGSRLKQIRADIQREYSSHGPATPTPPPPEY